MIGMSNSRSMRVGPSGLTPQPLAFENNATQDLKAFERRLLEISSGLRPVAIFWKVAIVVAVALFLISLLQLRGQIDSPSRYLVRPLQFATDCPLFVFSSVFLTIILACGALQKRRIDAIVMERCRSVLTEYFNLNCDDDGKLILRARPAPR